MKDITGQKYNLLTAIEYTGNGKGEWLFRCDCGNEVERPAGWITRNVRPIKSCGCIKNVKANWTGCGEISGTYWSVVRKNAASRSLRFNIQIEEAWQIFVDQQRLCALTGFPLVFAQNYNNEEQTASLDRIDNSIGYIKSNVFWTHKDVNRMRMDLDVDTFRRWCARIAEFEQNITGE